MTWFSFFVCSFLALSHVVSIRRLLPLHTHRAQLSCKQCQLSIALTFIHSFVRSLARSLVCQPYEHAHIHSTQIPVICTRVFMPYICSHTEYIRYKKEHTAVLFALSCSTVVQFQCVRIGLTNSLSVRDVLLWNNRFYETKTNPI